MSASVAPECNEVKEKYDTCFLRWYSEKYLRGIGSNGKNECEDLFNDYKKCLTVALKKRGVDKLIEEAREDNKEADALHLGRRCKIKHHRPEKISVPFVLMMPIEHERF